MKMPPILERSKVSFLKQRIIERLLFWSLKSAADEQGLSPQLKLLRSAIPDLKDQYTQFKVEGEYLETKVRMTHAFQVSLIRKVIGEFDAPIIVDIGDSSGTHLKYIMDLFGKDQKLRTLSVNMDSGAVERIRRKGLEAICARAEDLAAYDVNANILLSFEMLEHLSDPCRFLHDLSMKTKAEYFILTVPYRVQSRVGLDHLRAGNKAPVFAENTHIFELSPNDWRLLVQHAGWKVERDEICFQYPQRNPLCLTRTLWRKFDYEGFYGMILKRDHSWSDCYKDW